MKNLRVARQFRIERNRKLVKGKMAAFPCPLERTVASALLLLSVSATPPSLISPPPKYNSILPFSFPFLLSLRSRSLCFLIFTLCRFGDQDEKLKDGRKRKSCRESLVLRDSNDLLIKDDVDQSGSVSMSCSSSLTSEVSSEEIRDRRMRLISVMARRHQLKLKVISFLCYFCFPFLCLFRFKFTSSV